jgi:capsule polysaccharide export protein KpsC/LpsZ
MRVILTPRTSQPNSFLLSYHSIGEKLPNILRYKDGYLNNMITFDSKGHSGWSSLCDDNIEEILPHINHTKATQFFHQLKKNHIQKNQSKYTQPNEDNFPFPKKFIFFPLQTVSDSVMLHSYFNPIELLQNIVQILHKKKIALVVKRHPRCENSELAKLLTQYEKEKKLIIFNGSIHQAIAKADTIYTINSGVGFESLLHLKPVVTFGKSDYMSMTKNISNLNDLKNHLFHKLSKQNKSDIKRFLYYYLNTKSIFLDDTKKFNKLLEQIILTYLDTNGGGKND